MATLRWPRNVLRKKALLVTLSKTAASQGWNVIFDKALAEINQVMKDNNIELTYGKPDNPINAYIVIDTKPGHGLHGNALIASAKDGQRVWIDSVKIELPATPRVNPKDPKSRLAGSGVRLFLLVHELIHCVGLTNDDHTPGDVFSDEVQLISGKSAADDKVQYDAQHNAMPPIHFDGATLTKIKSAWPSATN
jgi:hypothetical protein